MTSNSTISISNGNLCKITEFQLKLHIVAFELNFYLYVLIGLSYPIAIVAALLTLVSLFTIRGWRNSCRNYYYVIGVANFIAALSTDWLRFLLALASWAVRWFPNGSGTVTLLHWELLWTPLCALFNFVIDSILLPKLWVLILFCMHRTWIVLEPLRAPQLKSVFRPALVIGLPVSLVVFFTPHLWLSSISEGTHIINR